MKKNLCILLLLITSIAFCQKNVDFQIDSIDLLTKKHIFKTENIKQFKLTEIEIQKVKSIIKSKIDSLNNSSDKIIIPEQEYFRQYIGFINSKGEKLVYVNSFCDTHNKNHNQLKEQLLKVKDGGSCYYQTKINLTTSNCFSLIVNGSS